MKFLVLILSIIIFIKTTSYGLYELKENQNKIGGVVVITIATISLALPNVVVFIRGV